MKHFVNYLQSEYKIQNGFFTYEKRFVKFNKNFFNKFCYLISRLLYSTFTADDTFYLQVVLALKRHLPVRNFFC